METIYLIIPNWFYSWNLGDSVHWTFGPKILKKEYPNSKLICVAVDQLYENLKDNPYVDEVHYPTKELIMNYAFWEDQAKNNRKDLPKNMFVLFAVLHPKVWEYWNNNFEFLQNHPTANIIYVNSLLQLGMEKYLYDDTNLYPIITITKPEVDPNLLGIVPATKLSGKSSPHPGCDGIGFRFNGDTGDSWKRFVSKIRELNKNIKIVEFSKENFGFGDYCIGHLPWKELAYEAAKVKVVVLSDGGMHHVFNSQDKPIVFLGAQTINKPHHYTHKNTKVYWDLFEGCHSRCLPVIKTLTSWRDLAITCDKTCEKVDADKLAFYTVRDFFSE